MYALDLQNIRYTIGTRKAPKQINEHSTHLSLILKPNLTDRHASILLQVRPRRIHNRDIIFLIPCAQSAYVLHVSVADTTTYPQYYSPWSTAHNQPKAPLSSSPSPRPQVTAHRYVLTRDCRRGTKHLRPSHTWSTLRLFSRISMLGFKWDASPVTRQILDLTHSRPCLCRRIWRPRARQYLKRSSTPFCFWSLKANGRVRVLGWVYLGEVNLMCTCGVSGVTEPHFQPQGPGRTWISTVTEVALYIIKRTWATISLFLVTTSKV